MEEVVPVSEYIKKTPWYQTGMGEAVLVIFLLITVGIGIFVGSVAFQVRELSRLQGVEDVAGVGAMSPSLNPKPFVNGPTDFEGSDSMSLGNSAAELTIVEFADFGCPYSENASSLMREMAAKYPSRFRYIFRDFPNTELHPDALNAALAGRCAAAQGKFWAYHDKLFANQGAQDLVSLARYAAEIGADTDDFNKCLVSKKYAREVQTDFEAGVQAGIRGTPTFFLNGHRAEGSLPADKFEALLLKITEK